MKLSLRTILVFVLVTVFSSALSSCQPSQPEKKPLVIARLFEKFGLPGMKFDCLQSEESCDQRLTCYAKVGQTIALKMNVMFDVSTYVDHMSKNRIDGTSLDTCLREFRGSSDSLSVGVTPPELQGVWGADSRPPILNHYVYDESSELLCVSYEIKC